MCVSSSEGVTQIAVLEGRSLMEHYVSHPANDWSEMMECLSGKVQNVLPGMEAAFVDIGTPKNAVLYRGDLQFDDQDIDELLPEDRRGTQSESENRCTSYQNPIAHKGARLSQEVCRQIRCSDPRK